MSKSAIINGKILTHGSDQPTEATLFLENDLISDISPAEPSRDLQVIDAKGAIVAPGIVDLGVFATDKPAFRYGGITRAALLPDQSPILDLPAMIKNAALAGKPDFWVHPLGAASMALEGQKIAEFGLMKASGAKGVSTGRKWIANSGMMHKILVYAASLDLPVIVHSQDAGLVGSAVATRGETATRLGLVSAPSVSEALAVGRDLLLAEDTGAHIHFRQVTTARALDMIRAAKDKGLRVTCGITPAHLFLSDIAISGFRTFARLSPPLRCEEDRQACLAAIADGTIDVISSGHDPRGPEDKRRPFADAEPGNAGAETLLALSLNLVRDGHITISRLFELLSTNPAQILGVNAGKIAHGAEADLIFVKPDAPWQIDSEKMAASAGNTPFDKMPVQGRVSAMLKGGKAI